MKIKSIGLSLAVISVLSIGLTGCGGSSSAGTSTTNTGTGTYLDSAVQGIPYCIDGSLSGTTNADGEFTYVIDKPIEFKLGSCAEGEGLTLKTIGAEDLNTSDFTVVETNSTVAALLQTLDQDGNASNGITITDDIKKYFDDKNVTELNTTSIVDGINQELDLTLTEVNTTAAIKHVLNTIETHGISDTAKADALVNITKTIKAEDLNVSEELKTLIESVIESNTTSQSLNDAMFKTADDLNITSDKITEAVGELNATANNITTSTGLEGIVADLTNYDPETDSIATIISTNKPSADSTNADDKLLLAILDIVEIINSDKVQSLANRVDGSTIDIDFLVGDTESKVEIATAATIAGGTDVLHDLATRLKTASDTIDGAFESELRVFDYSVSGTIAKMNYNDSLAIRATALAVANKLEFISSYSYGDISQYKTNEETIDGRILGYNEFINIPAEHVWLNSLPTSNVYEYTTEGTDPVALLNDPTFFKMTSTVRLALSGDYLKEAALLISKIDNTKLTDTTSILVEDIAEATKIKDAMYSDGKYTNGYNSTNLNNLFSSNYYLDRDDFPSNYKYYDINGTEEVSLNSKWTTITNEPMYDPSITFDYSGVYTQDMQYFKTFETTFGDTITTKVYLGAEVQASTQPTESTSSLDEVILTVENQDGNGSVTIFEKLSEE